MSRSIALLGSGPACELAKLIVQVIGKDHPAEQQVVLCTADNQVLEDEPESLERRFCSSALHVWDCAGQSNLQLWLEIATIEGEPIRLPLLAQARETQRQADAQWNQLVPVLPFVSLPGAKVEDDLGTPVLVRAGFIYVFFQGKLWRELEVRVADGKTTYHDVNVAAYRFVTFFALGERKVTGKALDEIWLPARLNNEPVRDLQLCFSEIQLTAERLQLLELDSDLRGQRCKNFQDLTCSNKSFEGRYAGRPDGQAMLEAFAGFDIRNPANSAALTQAAAAKFNVEAGFFPVSVVAPQRPREPGFEWLLEHPGRYVCDLTGQFPVTAARQAKAFLAGCATGNSENNDPVTQTGLLEMSAVADALQASMPAAPDGEPEPAEEKTDIWQAQASAVDVLANARQRQLCGVLLEDPRYRLRHLKARLESHRDLLQLCALHATQQANHASALLIQQLVVPRELRGQLNPLHAGLEKLASKGRQDINRCTAVLERATVWQHMESAQKLLTQSLQRAVTQQTLADHLSLDGFDYIAALLVISQTLATLAASPARLDPLAPSGDVVDAVSGASFYSPKATPGQQWLSELADNINNNEPLHRMLWPEWDMESVCRPYEAPDEPAINQGDGLFRAYELARHENKMAPDVGEQTTLDASIIANLLAGASFNNFLTTSGKNLSSALMSIYETLQGAVDTAQAATDTLRNEVSQAQDGVKTSEAEKANANARLDKTKARLAELARPVKIKLHAQGVEQLRSVLPKTFGAAYFERRGRVSEKYYVLGLEELPSRESVPKTIHGEFLSKNGDLLGSTQRSRMPEQGVTTANHLVLVIPRDNSTAQLLGNKNRQLTAAQQAAAQANTATDNLTQTRSALADTIEQHNTRSNAQAFRILNSRPFSVGVLMLEIWNVNAEMRGLEQSSREKGGFRAVSGVVGAWTDLILAMEALTVKFVGTQSALRAARNTLFEIPESFAKKWLGEIVAERLIRTITTRLLVQSFAGIVFAGLNLYDAWYAWQWNDNAMYGYLLMAGGAMAGFAANFIIAAPILGLTPLGWLALLLVGGGAGLVLWLSNTPLQDWLANGPFGADISSMAEHLQDPQEAFYRLIGLLAGISISIGRNPLFEPNAKLDGQKVPFEVRNSSTVIRIESRLPGLLGALGSVSIQAECRLCEVVMEPVRGIPSQVERNVPDQPTAPEAQRLYSDALELYVTTPATWGTIARYRRYEWAVRAQFVLSNQSEKRYFPAPAVKDPTLFGKEHARANFDQTDRPFWADEQTHKARNV